MFATARASEFFELRSLQAQTGQPARCFGDVVVKELFDDALDAAETANVNPEVALDVVKDDGQLIITVADNGPGMSADLIEGVLDFSVLVSDKAAYRSPTRGLQGNGLKTVFGIPHALGSTAPVVIDACGLRHTIDAAIDPAGELRIDHQQTKVAERVGTAITVTIPAAGQVLDADRWPRRFALVNPHMTLTYQGKSAGPADTVFYKPTTGEGWRKPVPGDPTSAHWYDAAALTRLVFAHINHSRRGGRDLPLGQFVRSFAGLSSTGKAKQVCALVAGVTRLSDFEADPVAVGRLLTAMQEASKVPKPDVLGKVDEDHYRGCFADWYGVTRHWFKRVASVDGGVPWVVEVAIAETEEPGELFYAVNYSPTFDDPLARLPLSAGELSTTGAASMLRQMDAYPDGAALRAASVHLISPAVAFLDRGKTTLAITDDAF